MITSLVRTALFSAILSTVGIAAAATTTAAPAATSATSTTADPAATRSYIDAFWARSTRSMDDCSAFGDTKISAKPVLYLPADLPAPADLDAIKQRCKVEVRVLPRAIHRLGEFAPTRLPAQGLLYLPHRYVIPGGMFNEMYGWDSYFIMLGLMADQHQALSKDMVDNFLFEVQHYGAVLNANRTYYLTRSQPPFLGAMIRALLDDPKSFDDAAAAQAWLKQAYPLAVRDHGVWTSKGHQAGDTGLARYFDYGHGPVPEIDSVDYYVGVIKYLVAHPTQDRGYLVKAAEHPDAAAANKLKTTSCDTEASKICAGAWADGHRLSADFYLGDRAMRESGFDTTFRFGAYSGSTHHYAAAGLNSLLYRYEQDLAWMAQRLGKTADAKRWQAAAKARQQAMDKYLWQPARGMYFDYDFVAGKRSSYTYVTTFFPLWALAASPAQAAAVREHMGLFERIGGLQMSDNDSGAQWDAPFGWAPTNWLAAAGLEAYGYGQDARSVAKAFTATIDRSFAHDGTIREKYNVETGDAKVDITAGYSANVIGFGWTNGVYLKLQQLLRNQPTGIEKSKAAAPVSDAPMKP